MPAPPSDRETLLRRIVERLLSLNTKGEPISLDAIGEVTSEASVSYDEIEFIIDRIEAAGCSIAQPEVDLQLDLRKALASARTLRAQLARAPRIDEIASATGMDPRAVLAALRFAQTFR